MFVNRPLAAHFIKSTHTIFFARKPDIIALCGNPTHMITRQSICLGVMYPRIDGLNEPMHTGVGSSKPDLESIGTDTGDHIAFQQICFRICFDERLINLIVLTDALLLSAKPNAIIVHRDRSDLTVYQAI